ncbi:MAG: hypothetical protein AB7U82_27890 [Blastocatellales bacterium]
MAETWLRQPHESARAFKAFESYRDAGAERSLQSVAVQIGRTSRTVERYSAAHNWVDRAKDFDLYQQNRQQELFDNELRADARAEAEKWRQRRIEYREAAFVRAEKLLQRADEMMKFPLQQVERKGDNGETVIIKPYRWNANSIVHLNRLANELIVMATGIAPGSHPLDEVEWDKMSLDDLNAILNDQPVSLHKEKTG